MIGSAQFPSAPLARSLSLALTLLVAASPALAQTPPRQQARPAQQPPSAEQIRRFVSSFEAGVNAGCLRNPPRDQPNPARYCACYARTLVTQYQPMELSAINSLAAASPDNANIIVLMAAPFARACKAALIRETTGAGSN